MPKFRITPIILILLVSIVMINPEPVWANTDTTGGNSNQNGQGNGYAYAFPITITASTSCSVQSIGVNWADTGSGNVRVSLYSAGSGKPASLLGESSSVAITTSPGWQDIPVSSSSSITAGTYWVAAQISVVKTLYLQFSTESYYLKSYGSFDATWSASSTQLGSGSQWNMRVTYSCGPPPSDFTITAETSSQTVGAGSPATYLLDIQFSSTLTATVSLAVTSGCPTGVTCMITPNQVTATTTGITLSVPTLITTPGGTTTVTVTATCTTPSLSHTVQVQLTVNGPGSYPVYVYAGSSRVIVTASWGGSGTATIYLVGPGGSPTLTESGATVYDRTVYVTGNTSPTYIHRVTFTLSPPTTTQTWNALVSLSGSYTVTVEVNSPSPPE